MNKVLKIIKTGFILDTFCVWYRHAIPFLNFFEHFLTPKTLNLHSF